MKKKELENVFQGFHNTNLEASRSRLIKGKSYQDLSTIWITPIASPDPTKSPILYPRVVTSWMGVMRPMNQKFAGPFFLENMEVGEAYNNAIEFILNNPELRNWKYILTVEQDNMPPADGVLKLYESMDKFDVVGGLYWTKGELGQPMIYGDPNVLPKNFIPQIPRNESVQEANGLGMGFNLFKMEIFKKMQKPWFKTVQANNSTFSQDLFFYNNASAAGFRFACDTRIKVGHYDPTTGIVW